MKTKNTLIILFLSLIINIVFSQEKTKNQLKEETKIVKQKETEILVNSKEFVFIARNVSPQGYRTINLSGNGDNVMFQPEMIKSDMPFFGKSYGGSSYGSGDGGIKFEGAPKVYTIEKTKKYYRIKVEVKGERDFYDLLLSVYFEGNATLSISSNTRSTISYSGKIYKIEKKVSQ